MYSGERGWGEGRGFSRVQPPHPRPLSPAGERGEIRTRTTAMPYAISLDDVRAAAQHALPASPTARPS